MNSNLLLRRYALKPATQPAVGQHAGVMIHRVVHNAMLGAADEAGLIPHDKPGQEQYHTFAKYRDLADQELANPDSPFTKMFNRHKAEISRVPNPQEHLKSALTPMFRYLAKHGEDAHLPIAEPIHEEESEPIDLLGGEHHPLEESGGGFEYKPHVPNGFVELPKPKPKKSPSPIRNDVYKSIAEHSDMGWSAPSKLKDYLVQKHGITPQEATTHIANFRRKTKKPAAPVPKETKRVWPPVTRKSRNTDLMAIPLRYAYKKPSRIPEGWGSIDTRTPGGYEGWEKDFPDQVEDRGEGDTHEITLEDDKPVEEEPVKNQAFRAPKGGVIVRGTQYKGGSLVPSMTSPFMNPRRKATKKIS